MIPWAWFCGAEGEEMKSPQHGRTDAIASTTRRSFIKGGALAGLSLAAAGVASAWGSSALAKGASSKDMDASARTDDSSAADRKGAGEEKVVWTHCAVNCGCSCAWRCHVVDGVITYIETDNTGSPEFGERQMRACGRGRSARRWLQSPDRLNYPLKRVEGTKRGEGKYEQISWDEALDLIHDQMVRINDTYHAPEAFEMHYASGVSTSKIGSSPFARLLNMTVGGYLKEYGSYSSAQIAQAGTYTYGGGTYGSSFLTLQDNELVVLFSDAVTEGRPGGVGHTYDFGVMREQKHLRVISIDPRLNDTTAGQGGEWIPIRPGTDGALCCALAYEIIHNGWADEDFLHTYCVGYDEETMPDSAKGQHKSYKDYILGTGYDMIPKTPAWAAPITGIPEQRIIDLAREMHEADPVYIAQGYGINRRANGEITSRCVMVLPQLLGQIGKPGTTDGRREGCSKLNFGSFPTGDNGCTTSMPTFEWPNAIDHGEELTALNAGIMGADRLPCGIKFMMNYAGNCLTNQHSAINHAHKILQDESKCEFIVTSEVFMTDSAKYSDLILPDLTSQEQISVVDGGYADNMHSLLFGEPVYDAPFERRGFYEVCCDLADRFGILDEFSEGKTREQWLKEIYEGGRAKHDEWPTWDELREQHIWKETPQPLVRLAEFVDDPVANPLKTPSGKIEIYSEKLAGFADTWELGEGETISPLPIWDPAYDGVNDLTDEYPLLISGFQSKAHTHSSYGNNPIIASVTHDSAWINPVDAEPRDIKTGDTIRVWTAYGEMLIPALVTPRVIPGTVCCPAGAWHDADMDGDMVDHGGCINTITHYHPTALGKANPQHSNVGNVAKA